MNNKAIGVFDSGLGGLTAVKEFSEILKGEDIIYFGDTSRVPYGVRSFDTIIKYTKQDINFLKTHNIKAIVVACGTVSSVALDHIEEDIPIVGVVEPACLKAISVSQNKRIAVIGTSSTIKSGSYENLIKKLCPDATVIAKACPLFVPLVENGRFTKGDVVIETVAREYLSEFLAFEPDVIILGCTHYPLLRDIIADIFGDAVYLVDPGREAVIYTKQLLESRDMQNIKKQGSHEFYVSDDPRDFATYAKIFLKKEIENNISQIDITEY